MRTQRAEGRAPGERVGRSLALPRDTALNLLGALLPMAVTFFTVPAYLRAIGDARYGVLTLVWLIVGYFGLFDLGLGRATTNRMAKMRDADAASRSAVFWTAALTNLGLGAVGAFVLWVLIRLWGTQVFGIPPELVSELHASAWIIALSVPLVTVSSVLIGSLDALQEFGRANAVGVFGATLTATLPLVGALTVGPTLGTVTGATVIGRLVAGFVALLECRRAGVFEGVRFVTRRDLRQLLNYGGWVTVSSVIGPFLTSLDRFLISSRLGANVVPFYAVPFSLMTRVQVLAGSLQRALFPRLSEAAGNRAREAALRSMIGLAAVMTPALVVVAPLFRPFMGWWIGPPFAEAAGPVGELLVVGVWANSLAFIPFGLLQAQGRPDLTAKFHMAELVPYLVVLWIGLRYCGLAGAAFAWSLRVIVDAVLLLVASKAFQDSFHALRGPAMLIVLSTATSWLLPHSLGPRIVVVLGLGALSVAWSWKVLAFQFPGLVGAGRHALRKYIVPRGQIG